MRVEKSIFIGYFYGIPNDTKRIWCGMNENKYMVQFSNYIDGATNVLSEEKFDSIGQARKKYSFCTEEISQFVVNSD